MMDWHTIGRVVVQYLRVSVLTQGVIKLKPVALCTLCVLNETIEAFTLVWSSKKKMYNLTQMSGVFSNPNLGVVDEKVFT